MVRAIYAIDDIAKWKIDKKLEYMKEYDPECVEVNIQFDDPEYRIKKSTGLLISMRGERLKKAIREKYKSRINNYFFDIIIHIGDNVYQSEYMRTIFDPGIDLNKIITILDKYPYALAKTEVPYYPIEFPDKIPVGKDVDVFCRSEDINIIKDEIVKNLDNNKYDIIIINSPCGIQIRLQIGGLLIFLIDMIFKDKTLGEKFIKEAINTRIIKNSFQVINRKYEYIYRMNAYACNRGKKHHKEYLINNRADYDKDLVKEYLDIDLENLLY